VWTAVSIRSRLCGAGEPGRPGRKFIDQRFQSAPAFVGRENDLSAASQRPLRRFQSAPAFVGRENGTGWIPFLEEIVSIRSRLCGAGEHLTLGFGDFSQRFQSAPAFVGRENTVALRPRRGPGCFNPLPPLWGGRTLTIQIGGESYQFQSAPAFVGRENYRSAGRLLRYRAVSIRSRLCGAGEQHRYLIPVAHFLFQSAPAFVGRENAITHDQQLTQISFQSAPAFVGRENAGISGAVRAAWQVSIRSRLCGAGEQSNKRSHNDGYEFQSAPAFVGRENRYAVTDGGE